MPYGRIPRLTVRETPRERARFEMRFDMSDTDVSMANAIRRTMIAEVPTMAIDLVTVLENTSPLHDEYIVHRLGLIPLHSDRIEEFQYAHECEECEDHCSNCSVTFELNVQAHTSSDIYPVTSRHLTIIEEDGVPLNSVVQSVTPVHDSGEDRLGSQPNENSAILIAKLSRGQKIHMTMLARKGLGKDHAKWSPMCTVAYRIVPPAVELRLDRMNELFSVELRAELAEFSQGLLKVDENGRLDYNIPFKMGRIAVTPDTTRKSGTLAMQVGRLPTDVIKYNPKPERFEFTAETTGALSPRRALGMAIEILQRKIDTLAAHQR